MAKEKTPQRAGNTKLTRTEQRQKERLTEQRRRRIIGTVIGVASIVLIAFVVFIASNTPADAPIPETVSRYDSIPQSVTDKGYPRIGSLDGIRVSLFTSFGCTDCDAFHTDVLPDLLTRVEAGDISLTYMPVRAGSVSNFNGATRSALCAARQGKFFQYADALVSWTGLYGSGAFADNRLTTGAVNLGLDKALFDQCRSAAPENAVFEQALADAGGRDATLVPPSVFVNDVAVTNAEGAPSIDIIDINRAIDGAIDFRTGGDSQPTAEPATEAEATLEPTSAAESTSEPTLEPTAAPTEEATSAPTAEPTAQATDAAGATATP